jgi:hypothetical protein
LTGGFGNDSLYGNMGDDSLSGDEDDDILYGNDGNDLVMGGAGSDLLEGGADNDVLIGGAGNDTLLAGDGNDRLYGEDGDDNLWAGIGNDVLVGGAGIDTLYAASGNDILIGGAGKDTLWGEDGDDLLIGGTTDYDQFDAALVTLVAAWSSAATYEARLAQIESSTFASHLRSEDSVFDDQVSDALYGEVGRDWFFETGYMPVYLPPDVNSAHQGHTGHDHGMVVVSQPPAHDGFALVDAIDVLNDRQTNETISTLMPHADNPGLQREHLTLFQLVRYDQVTNYAVRSGAWSDPTTWQGGVVPGAGARVLIPVGVSVQVDGMIGARLATVRVDGTLSFHTSVNTQLQVDTIIVSHDGTFQMGTEAAPIAPGVTARLFITDNGAINRSWDPFGISRGLIAHGTVSIYGSAVSSYASLSVPAVQGAQTLVLKTVPVGWKVGDTVIVTATTPGTTQNESRQIVSIVGNSVTLNAALSYNHVAPSAAFDVMVANVTRNAVIESESTVVDRRGHVMFMHNRNVNIGYAGFYKLGRTDKSTPINDSVVQSDWTLKPGTGTNQRARYSVHFHRNGLANDGSPSIIRGSAVVDSAGWGFVNHSSNVDMLDNVAYDVNGAAFTTEVGDEIGGFYRNLAIGSTGSTDEVNARESIQDFGFQGDGFWFQGAGVKVVDNIAAGNQRNGFAYYTRGLIEGGVQKQFPAANLQDPSIAGGATQIPVGLVPVAQFSNNIAYGSYTGLFVRYHLEDATHGQNSIFTDSKFWNNTVGVDLPYVQHTVLRNLTVTNGLGTRPYVGVTGNISTQHNRYENLAISGYYFGLELPRRGTAVVEGGTFINNTSDILIYTASRGDRNILINNVSAQTKISTVLEVHEQYGYDANIFFVRDTIVLNYGPYVNQRLYFTAQQANAIPFPMPRYDVPAEYIGLTNQQMWDWYGVALGGEIAPANAFTTPFIIGLVGPPA